MISTLTSRFAALRGYTGGLAWSSATQLARSACLSLLQRIKVGSLEIVDTNGDIIVCGNNLTTTKGGSGPYCKLQVHSELFWVRLALFADMVNQP